MHACMRACLRGVGAWLYLHAYLILGELAFVSLRKSFGFCFFSFGDRAFYAPVVVLFFLWAWAWTENALTRTTLA